MSAIASFTLLPISCIPQLREAAVTLSVGSKYVGGKPKDNFWPFLEANGKEVATYNWSGFVIATLIPYLLDEQSIEFGEPEFEEFLTFLCNVRESSFVILTPKDRETYLAELDPEEYSEDELRNYFEKFNATKFEEAGKAMLDGIAAIRESLSKLDKESFVLLHIG